MSLQQLERTPPLFRRGPSPLTRLAMAGALSVFLMVADSRFHVGDGMRSAIATVLSPLQWLGAQPVRAVDLMGGYVTTVESAKHSQEQAALLVSQQSLKAQRADLLERENAQLRHLLGLSEALTIRARAAEVVYVAPDPFTRKVVINRGSSHGLAVGSPVIDEYGLVGQLVRVYPFSSEVSLIDNPEQPTPVLNSRTGERGLVYGDSQSPKSSALEVRFLTNTADFRVGDVLMTSGIGGIYPAGLPVGTVTLVDRRGNTAFERVQVKPAARPLSMGYVLVLEPQKVASNEATAAASAPDASAASGAASAPARGKASRNKGARKP